ncbi:hypothetical protein INQ73_28615, partial [Klebsiella pneumoniae]|uniref:hypothetical protein n=1 Tax=Klebsiella pneumoniae TaxID=573 RepID=UPI00397519E7|nr:hypothetical protein [Klebsiella pneumoniae]
DKHPQGDQHGVFDLFPYRHAQRQAAKIEAERIQLKGQGGERDVGRATLLAVLSALAVYLLVTLLSLGVVPRSELAEMRNPS